MKSDVRCEDFPQRPSFEMRDCVLQRQQGAGPWGTCSTLVRGQVNDENAGDFDWQYIASVVAQALPQDAAAFRCQHKISEITFMSSNVMRSGPVVLLYMQDLPANNN
jgi:hypothetical protein